MITRGSGSCGSRWPRLRHHGKGIGDSIGVEALLGVMTHTGRGPGLGEAEMAAARVS